MEFLSVVAVIVGMTTPAFAEELETTYVKEKPSVKLVNPDEYASQDSYAPAASSGFKYSKDESFPGGAVRAAQEALLQEERHQEMLQKRELRIRDEVEKSKKDALDEIAKNRRLIQDLKFQADKNEENIEIMKKEIVEFDTETKKTAEDLVSTKEVSADTRVQLEKVQQQHQISKNILQENVRALEETRADIALKIRKTQQTLTEMEGVQKQVNEYEDMLSRASVEKSHAEADELRVRYAWIELNKKSDDLKMQRENMNKDLASMREKLAKAQVDYRNAQAESSKIEKEVAQLRVKAITDTNRMTAEMERLNDDMLVAHKKSERNLAERERLQGQIDRTKEQLAIVKKQHEEAIAQLKSSDALVIESRIALNNAEGGLNTEMMAFERARSDDRNRKQKLRNLASMADASDMSDEMHSMTASKSCKIYAKPNGKSVGNLDKGTRVIASVNGGFAKILNSSGATQYVESGCLK